MYALSFACSPKSSLPSFVEVLRLFILTLRQAMFSLRAAKAAAMSETKASEAKTMVRMRYSPVETV